MQWVDLSVRQVLRNDVNNTAASPEFSAYPRIVVGGCGPRDRGVLAAVLALALASCSSSNSGPPPGSTSSGGRVGGTGGGTGGATITATGGAQGAATGGQSLGSSGGGGSSVGGGPGSNATGTGGRASGGPTGGQAGDGAGGKGQGGDAVVPAGKFPSQACLDRATTLLGQMTADEKFAQMMQMERAALTPAMVTQYGVGLLFSQGGSGRPDNSPSGWADMTDGFRQGALTSRLQIPVIYGIDIVHGVGPVKGATVFPHNIGLGATRDIALVEQIGRVTAEEAAGCGLDFPFSPVRRASRATSAGAAPTRRSARRRAGVGDGRGADSRPAARRKPETTGISPAPSTTWATAAPRWARPAPTRRATRPCCARCT